MTKYSELECRLQVQGGIAMTLACLEEHVVETLMLDRMPKDSKELLERIRQAVITQLPVTLKEAEVSLTGLDKYLEELADSQS